MYRAFTGALALALALLVLHWAFPELAEALLSFALKLVTVLNAVLDQVLANLQARQ